MSAIRSAFVIPMPASAICLIRIFLSVSIGIVNYSLYDQVHLFGYDRKRILSSTYDALDTNLSIETFGKTGRVEGTVDIQV
jgi:hypothetical protein